MKDVIEFNDYKNWYNNIVYAPNSTGKTRLAYKIFENYNSDNKLLFTSKEIDNLLKISLSKRRIYIGLTAQNSLENDYILEDFKKNKDYKTFVKKYWNVSSASELKTHSAFFKFINCSSISFDKYFLNIIKNDEIIEGCGDVSKIDELVKIDKMIDYEAFCDIKKYIFSDKITEKFISLDENINDTFTSDELNIFYKIKDIIITKNIDFCPICGYKYLNNEDLLYNVNRVLNDIVVNDKPNIENKLLSIWRRLNRKYNGLFNNIVFNQNYAVLNLIDYYTLCIKTFNEIHGCLITNSFINGDIYEIKKKQYIFNENKIKEEDKKFESNMKVYDDIYAEFNKLISLPAGCSLIIDNNDFMVSSENGMIDVSSLLSESEKKRFALIVLKSYIENFGVELVILDDPIDSYDDYYSEEAINYITDIINNNKIKWVVLTHMYDFITSFTKKINSGFKLIAYFYKPTYKIQSEKDIYKKTPLIKKQMKLKGNVYDGEEVIMINNLLKSNKNDYLFVLLSSFSIIRTLVNEINCLTKISYKESKIKRYTELLEGNYLHYSGKNIKTKKIIDLYKKLFYSFNSNLITSEYINQDRNKYYLMKYEDIKINNEFVKYILYVLFKIEYLKYMFEEKIYKMMENNMVKKEYLNKFTKIHTLGKKIKYLNDNSLINEDDLKTINIIFDKYRTIINDYSHSYSRLYAPYLSANMKDIALFEYSISKL